MTQHRSSILQPSAEWESLFHSYRPLQISYAPGEMICQAGSYLAGIHLIVQGVVSDMMLTQTGEPRNCDILSAGDLIGLETLENDSAGLSISLCRALTCVDLLFIEGSQFASALDDHPALLRTVFHYAVSRVVHTRKDSRHQTSFETQLCRLLLRLGDACGLPTAGNTVSLPSEVSLRTLGDILCLSTRQLRHARQAIQHLVIRESGIEFDVEEARQIIRSE